MSFTDRFASSWTAALGRRSLDARIRLVSRAALSAVALFLVVALSAQAVLAGRLSALQRDAYPAARDAQRLGRTLDAFRTELREHAADAGSPLRADSLADAFHRIARGSAAPGMAAADARFAEYMLLARRVPPGGVAAPVAATATSEAEESFKVLDAQLASDAEAADQQVSGALEAVRSAQAFTLAVLLVGGGVALLALLGLGVAAHASLAVWVNGTTATVDALAQGNVGVIIRDSGDDLAGRLGDALRRLARQQRENAETAFALASGTFRRAARAMPPQDPIGAALARLTRTMEEIADTAQRVARGDLRAAVAPQSPDDAFGQAHAAMMRRITTTLRDVEATRVRISTEIEEMRGDAAALAASTAADADRLRRAAERVSGAAIQARSDAERSATVAERAGSQEALLEQGSTALQASLGGVREVLQRSESVQRLARNAGILAVCAMADAGQVQRTEQASGSLEGEARALATEAADVARVVTRIMIDGTEHAYGAGVAIDAVVTASGATTGIARELSATTQRQAAELVSVEEKVAQVQAAMVRSAEGARTLTGRLDQLSSHVRQLETVLRRLNRGHSPVIMATSPGGVARGPSLYVTPPHAAATIPRLAMVHD